jgi:DNA-binding winged helix-turn-helix (wHTH) protein
VHRVRFGGFELDLRSQELRKGGVRVALPGQSAQVLALLLERPGELVTRDALRQRLWPAGTYVDFEHGLNAVVKRLRHALGDSAEQPRFIETLARRGYRFIAAVDVGGPDGRPGRGRPASPLVPALLVGLAVFAAVASRIFRSTDTDRAAPASDD